MYRINIVGQALDTGLRATKKALAKLMGIKRLQAGANFAEDARTGKLFVGERQHNMGDLWREPSDRPSLSYRGPPNFVIGE